MRKGVMIPVLLSLLASLAGCGNHREPIVDSQGAAPVDPRFEATWQAALGVLGEYRFQIDRKDKRAGVITTRPLLGRHGLEFWRRDATTMQELLEGTLQTVYRAATVRIMPDPKREGGYVALVEVKVSRPGRQETEIVGAGEAYDQFTDTYEDDDYTRRERAKARRRDLREQGEYATGDGDAEDGDPELVRLGSESGLARELADEIRREADGRLEMLASGN
jgi:hypothetical protein